MNNLKIGERNLNECCGCGLVSPDVECVGIYHCPNKFCLVSGAFPIRFHAGYQDKEGNQTEEQLARMIADCRSAVVANPNDDVLIFSLARLIKRQKGSE